MNGDNVSNPVDFVGADIAKRLKDIRLSLNLTQAQFAENCGLSQAAISQYESGSRGPSFDALRAIAVNCTIDELVKVHCKQV